MHRGAPQNCVWDSSAACRWVYEPVGQICGLTYPLKPSYAGEPGHISLIGIDIGTCFKVEVCKALVRPNLRCWINLLLPSMKRAAFQLFLTRSASSSFSISFVPRGATS